MPESRGKRYGSALSASLQVEGFQGNKCYFTGALYWI